MSVKNIKYYLLYLLSDVSSKGVPLLLLPFLARNFNATQMGQIAEFTAIFNFIFMLGEWASSGFIRKKIFDKGVVRPLDYYFPILVNSGFWVLFFTFIVFLCSMFFGVLQWFTIIDYFFLAAASFFLVILRIRFSIFNSLFDALSYFKWNLFYGVCNITLSIVFVLYSILEINNGRVYGMMFAPILCVLIMMLVKPNNNINLVWDVKKCKEAYFFGSSLLVHQVSSWARVNFDKVVLASVITIETLGRYSVNSQLAMVLFVVFTALNQALAPKILFLLKNQPSNFKVFKKKIYISFLLVFIFILSGVLFVSEFLVGTAYKIDYLMLVLLAFSYFINGIYLINTHSIIQGGYGKTLSKVSLVSSIVSIVLVASLIKFLAVWAVVFASLISSLTAFLLTYKYSRKIEQDEFNVT